MFALLRLRPMSGVLRKLSFRGQRQRTHRRSPRPVHYDTGGLWYSNKILILSKFCARKRDMHSGSIVKLKIEIASSIFTAKISYYLSRIRPIFYFVFLQKIRKLP